MSVWVCVPSKRPAAEVKHWAEAWKDQGYEVALWRDPGEHDGHNIPLDLIIEGEYPGYASATNELIHACLGLGARWCVIGGDDVFPDTTKPADEIARECEEHFARVNSTALQTFSDNPHETFGVVQPTGDPWADGMGRIIERIAGSAWIGREFALRAYGGNGPLWPEFWHMFSDEHLKCVAEKLGIYWMRPDLCQRHEHWARKAGATREDMPEFLTKANSAAHWAESKAIFERLKAGGFAEAHDLIK